MNGALLPMGEYKGYGLSFATEVLTAILGGSAYGTRRPDSTRPDYAHQFTAYSVDWFSDRQAFYERVRDFIKMVKSSRLRPGFNEILLPGELEWRRMQEKKERGVPLDPETLEDLKWTAIHLNLNWPFVD